MNTKTRHPSTRNELVVIAGVNGAGKSTIAGHLLEQSGHPYVDPDKDTERYMAAVPGISRELANQRAWEAHVSRLRRVVDSELSYVFETTLGGQTITDLLQIAIARGKSVRMWYIGLADVETHIRRVKERYRAGGHDIPEPRIRERYLHSREHLIELLPGLTELVLIDNSRELSARDNADTVEPPPRLLHWVYRRILEHAPLAGMPVWAKPIIEAALRAERR